ncbi:hypothetical protein PHYBLDRAFT_149414 [Phycomyces blakesleeanus NRRL 1555(-)]|uniref:Uncharacterized protein n=1 Tax=Phycomyces blakesleeanus (strain ATCC 8743b / DSM 1359 / FGSC 10004 / NBRC 33097 / NRRL 1555) TaxID=763407 RepID=A0A167L5C8_PHYB8|nr:hypothetical protein PHYBLDRAFT_149414 [Phycomyces blakesleeanus NRRL 1555(-)]OAD69629.1 hypothetical protein PHYBLDRAFT_149414 [Phycomyces blakesleeanus NRRL 1555(-)]|eukprot:XP_018287669.1 hypothetical protein PHYBLDRAFT_149414 [Phycomyces blakesleeanus NRRL 1555(-)]
MLSAPMAMNRDVNQVQQKSENRFISPMHYSQSLIEISEFPDFSEFLHVFALIGLLLYLHTLCPY